MFLIDVQGTLIDDIDKKPIDGAIDFIDFLNSKNIPYIVITNNTKLKSEEFYKSLIQLGFNIPQNRYLDPFMILNKILKVKNLKAFGQDSFLNVLKELNYNLERGEREEEALIISIKKDYTNLDYANMIESALKCDIIIGMHETSLYAKDGKRFPGVGAIMKMIEFASNKSYQVVGKPSKNFYQKAKEMIGAKSFDEITIISDDMIGDLLGANRLGMKTILVLSGKIKDEDEVLPTLNYNEYPTLISKNMRDVLNHLKK